MYVIMAEKLCAAVSRTARQRDANVSYATNGATLLLFVGRKDKCTMLTCHTPQAMIATSSTSTPCAHLQLQTTKSLLKSSLKTSLSDSRFTLARKSTFYQVTFSINLVRFPSSQATSSYTGMEARDWTLEVRATCNAHIRDTTNLRSSTYVTNLRHLSHD